MTAHELADCAFCAFAAAAWEAAKTAPDQPWNEAVETQIDHHAQTYDEHDQTTRRLRRTR